MEEKDYKKLYEDTVALAKDGLKDGLYLSQSAKAVTEFLFPQLKETEDEKVKRELTRFLINFNNGYYSKPSETQIDSWVKWVDKKCGQKTIECIKLDNEFENQISHLIASVLNGEHEYNEGFVKYASQSLLGFANKEQNHTDKVEPKFKVGAWVRAISSGNIFKILSVNGGLYRVLCYDGVEAKYPIEDVDYDLAYWTIQDAKDGDVLSDEKPFIFRGFGDKEHPNSPTAYCGICTSGKFILSTENEWWTADDFYPATKEQRDLLFQKMKEAGYEWDAEKKELRKVEQKPADNVKPKFKVGDLIHNKWSNHSKEIVAVDDYQYTLNDGMPAPPFKVDIKEQDNWELVEHKHAWSEEDEQKLNDTIFFLNEFKEVYHDDAQNCIKWVKSFKPQQNQYDKGYNDGYSAAKHNQWKPKKEELEALRKRTYFSEGIDANLDSLYTNLLKL